jgi:NAD(P)-dependent dehydrogenase (short-subunit alcohol dehydrogenase family)
MGRTANVAEEGLARIWEFNVLGPLRLAGHAADLWMRSTGGSIVNVAWLPDPETDALSNAYRASQAALISVTRTLARQLAPVGIRVNAISLSRVPLARGVMSGPPRRMLPASVNGDDRGALCREARAILLLCSDTLDGWRGQLPHRCR